MTSPARKLPKSGKLGAIRPGSGSVGPTSRRSRPETPAVRSRRAAPRIAVLVDTSTTWGRGILRGVARRCRERAPWEIFVEPRGQLERMRLPRGWVGDGVIARIDSSQMAQELQATRLPVVNVSGIRVSEGGAFPRVTTDWIASGRMAARHFLDRGFQHFAYLELEGLEYVQEHRQAFQQAVGAAGATFTSQQIRPAAGAEPDWRLDLAQLAAWVRNLPKPVAVLCWNAGSARELIFACHEARIHVPEEVAVLSQADDELLCETSLIPISGIAVASDQIGYLAASVLEGQLHGRLPDKAHTLVAPAHIVARQSTQTIAMTDPLLIKAMSHIRQNAVCPSLGVPELARQVGASRRVLERHFARVLDRSPAEEIRRTRLETARQILVQTRLPMSRVAEASGFSSQSNLTVAFNRAFGVSPLQFRKQQQAGTSKGRKAAFNPLS